MGKAMRDGRQTTGDAGRHGRARTRGYALLTVVVFTLVMTTAGVAFFTRFTGTTDVQRLNSGFWRGGLVTVKQITLAPRAGLAIAAYDYQKQGGANVNVGTSAVPALVYVTHDVPALNSNYNHVGSLIVLHNYSSTGGPNYAFDPDFVGALPASLQTDRTAGVSGRLKVTRWREVIAPAS